MREDIGSGDLTGQLIPAAIEFSATIVSRQEMTMAGQPWAEEVFHQVDPGITNTWLFADGDAVDAGAAICNVQGPARSILTAERTALNFLQMLSATATATAAYVEAIKGTDCRILDTRKTIPGLRLAQKYAVLCGGGSNHRIGLFDAILIKENHIASAGGISAAVSAARDRHPGMAIEIEVESIEEMREALGAKAQRVLLDNFSLGLLQQAVAINKTDGSPRAELEASGGMTLDTVAAVAATGVDYISVGALTKNILAIDLSMQFE